jgi:hypothetical protein
LFTIYFFSFKNPNFFIFQGKTKEDMHLFTGMIVHSADFTGSAKKFEISRVWSDRVNKEFSE